MFCLVKISTPPNTRRSFKLVLYRDIWKCYLEVEVEELDTLAQDINGLKYSVQVASILDSNEPSIRKGMAQLGLKDNRPLSEWLDRYNANQPDLAAKPNFTTFPLDFKPSPCKPLFFDIALNHIELPSLDEKLEQNKSSPQGGLGGSLRGWWSGGEK
ncbi:signal recognition particle subunit SRP68-like [Apostichopus japonicus]|uniref:signal recognition particle subunit SRP68-like n=1 Tax=Stichopus japonicus TaxID=307972 RepID=UPI003AB47AA6